MFLFLYPQSPLSIQEWGIILLKETLRRKPESVHLESQTGGIQLTCRCSSVDGQQELFPHDFTLSFPHFSSPPTFSTLFLYLPLGALFPFPYPSLLRLIRFLTWTFHFLFLSPALSSLLYSPSTLNLLSALSIQSLLSFLCFPPLLLSFSFLLFSLFPLLHPSAGHLF